MLHRLGFRRGCVTPFEFRDNETGANLRIEIDPQITAIFVDGTEYKFNTLTGSFDGVAYHPDCTRDCKAP